MSCKKLGSNCPVTAAFVEDGTASRIAEEATVERTAGSKARAETRSKKAGSLQQGKAKDSGCGRPCGKRRRQIMLWISILGHQRRLLQTRMTHHHRQCTDSKAFVPARRGSRCPLRVRCQYRRSTERDIRPCRGREVQVEAGTKKGWYTASHVLVVRALGVRSYYIMANH